MPSSLPLLMIAAASALLLKKKTAPKPETISEEQAELEYDDTHFEAPWPTTPQSEFLFWNSVVSCYAAQVTIFMG